jgi:hypothetical protein
MTDLTAETLVENFEYWLSKLDGANPYNANSPPVDSPAKFLRTIPTTHSWGNGKLSINRREIFLFEKILFQDRGLLSKNGRHPCEDRGTKRQTVGQRAKDCGLENYVFAFLGGHEPYYAQSEFPAFGLFIQCRDTVENFPSCNASRRDLASEEIDAHEPVLKHFLLPKHGRALAEAETLHNPKFGGDPWRYWGTEEHWTEDSWQGKVEYHFRERVGIADFAAILWPVDQVIIIKSGISRETSEMTRRRAEFQTLAPHCAIITYETDPEDPATMFLRASSVTTRHYVQYGTFPQHIGPSGELYTCGG